jgi:hypothetical protein
MLTTHPLLAPRLRMSRTIPLLPSRPLVACYRGNLTLIIKKLISEVMWSVVMWKELTWFMWSELRWSSWRPKHQAHQGDLVLWVHCEYFNLVCILYCGCFNLFCNVWVRVYVCVGVLVCVRLFTVSYYLYCVIVLFRVCTLIICFVCTSARINATQWKIYCSKLSK